MKKYLVVHWNSAVNPQEHELTPEGLLELIAKLNKDGYDVMFPKNNITEDMQTIFVDELKFKQR